MLTAELENSINIFETKNFRKLLGVTYKDRKTYDEIKNRISQAGHYHLTSNGTTTKINMVWPCNTL